MLSVWNGYRLIAIVAAKNLSQLIVMNSIQKGEVWEIVSNVSYDYPFPYSDSEVDTYYHNGSEVIVFHTDPYAYLECEEESDKKREVRRSDIKRGGKVWYGRRDLRDCTPMAKHIMKKQRIRHERRMFSAIVRDQLI
jgi:hypothetical protein